LKIKFASYNMHKGVSLDRRRDPDRIISVLREINADIIALQEADMRLGDRASVLSRAALDDTHWRPADVGKRPRSLGWHGNAILVRRDFEILDAQPLDLPTLEPRGAARVDIGINGHRVRIIGTHLDLSGLRRRDQAKAILAHLDDCVEACPTVIMGDFNQWGVRGGAMQEFGDGWNTLPTGRTFPSRQPVARLDRIITSLEWEMVEHGVHHSALSAQASDHLPVWAELSMPKLKAVLKR